MIRLELDFFGVVLVIKLSERDRPEEDAAAPVVNADPPLTEYADPASIGFTGTQPPAERKT